LSDDVIFNSHTSLKRSWSWWSFKIIFLSGEHSQRRTYRGCNQLF